MTSIPLDSFSSCTFLLGADLQNLSMGLKSMEEKENECNEAKQNNLTKKYINSGEIYIIS